MRYQQDFGQYPHGMIYRWLLCHCLLLSNLIHSSRVPTSLTSFSLLNICTMIISAVLIVLMENISIKCSRNLGFPIFIGNEPSIQRTISCSRRKLLRATFIYIRSHAMSHELSCFLERIHSSKTSTRKFHFFRNFCSYKIFIVMIINSWRKILWVRTRYKY